MPLPRKVNLRNANVDTNAIRWVQRSQRVANTASDLENTAAGRNEKP